VLPILVKKTVHLEWLQKNQDIVFRMVVGKRVCTMDGSGTFSTVGFEMVFPHRKY